MKWLVRLVAVVGIAAVGFWLWANRHPEIAAIDQASLPVADADLLDKGESLAALGGCASCHGADLAGGVKLPTPFGAMYSTNITPDPETGIGTWSSEAFRRAMRTGIDREGGYLYPAFPYDHFTRTTDADIDAVYAWLMSRPTVVRAATRNELAFPFGIRPAMAVWNLLFLEEGPYVADPAQDDVWNRGAYLAESLGHCAACHTPRNALGALDRSRAYAGADVEGWHSPALNAESPAPLAWTMDSLLNYLFDGWDDQHGIAAGPMADVIRNVSGLPEEDVEALATYVLSLRGAIPDPDVDRVRAFAVAAAFGADGYADRPAVLAHAAGAKVFEGRCANCHRVGSETVPLALATALTGPEADNFLKVVVQGVTPGENAYFVRPMPGFPTLTDEELSDLATFARANFSTAPAWTDLAGAVADARP